GSSSFMRLSCGSFLDSNHQSVSSNHYHREGIVPMEKPWLSHYPEGVVHEISTEGYESLPDLLDRACERHANRRALVFMGQTLSYRELKENATAVAAWIQEQHLPPGSRVAL